MSVTLVPSSLGFGWGTPTTETGINVDKFTLTVKPEIDEFLPGPDGEAICMAIGDPMGDLDISGEIKGNSGVMAATFTTAFVPSNNVNAFGRTQGGFYLKEGERDYSRGTWNKANTKFSSRWNIP